MIVVTTGTCVFSTTSVNTPFARAIFTPPPARNSGFFAFFSIFNARLSCPICTHVVSGLAPAELEAELRRLQTNGPAAMIGSTSAAAALACADVGIGMGAEPLPAADVMLLRDDLADAAAAVRISRAVNARIAQNTRMALVYSALLPLLAAGVLYPLNFVLHPIDSVILMTLFVAWLLSGTARLNSFDPKPASQSEPQKEPAE